MAKLKRWELAYAGVFGEKGIPVTAQDLADVKETFTGRVPITLGHNLADYMPALGFITELSFNPQTTLLVGEKVELSDLIDDAFKKNMYGNWSVGVRTRKSDGKKYLHHVAVLGAQAPGIKDLKDLTGMSMVNMADDADTEDRWSFKLSDQVENWKFGRIGDILRRMRESIIADKGVEEADKIINTWEIEEISKPDEDPDEDETGETMMSDKNKPTTLPKIGGESKTEEEKQEMADKEKLKTLEAQLRAGKKEALKKAAEGKVPAGKMSLVMNLADTMSLEDTIELSDGDGKKTNHSALDILGEIFRSLPMPVKAGETDMGDVPDGQKTERVDPNKLIVKM